MKKDKKIIFGGGLLFALLLLILLRGYIIEFAAERKIKVIESRFRIEINYDDLSPSGLAGVKITGLSVVPAGGDTLLKAETIIARLNPWRLIILRPDLKYLEIERAGLTFVKRDSISNFDFLYNDKILSEDKKSIKKVDYSKITASLYNLFLDLMPSQAILKDVHLTYINKDYKLSITLTESSVENDKYTSLIISDENGKIERLRATGSLSDEERRISAIFTPKDSAMFKVPFLEFRWGAKLLFDTLSVDIKSSQRENEKISFSGNASASSISLFHPDISPEEVVLKKGIINYNLNIGGNYAELDSSSVITINTLSFSPFIRAEKRENWILTASLIKEDLDANELFSSLPKGLFLNLENIETSGYLDYRFHLLIDFNNIDSLKLESGLNKRDFIIRKMGRADLRLMNSEFLHTVYEKGEPVRSFTVGESNPGFTSLGRISPYLQMAVLQSEDGGFFYHNGFVPEGIRGAMAENLKKGRFARGGSSITMQLVKNVYLNRHKTLARKFEEILIVWLIENNRLVSKERMFEVYLNIIEWGPGIYGIREASLFWFNKEPHKLNINESIFLASIIPAPKRAFRNFKADYSLKEEMAGYYRLLAERLRVRGIISESEEASVMPVIILSDKAKSMISERK
ncbi:MAG: biosynthetic peptidoglycan transglycosylase [Bacteroidales bacterium]